MKIQAFVCPQCGGKLEVEEGDTFTTCPNCGNKIHISYSKDEVNPDLRTFTTPEGIEVASAILPSDYKTEAALNNSWQSEMVPSFNLIKAESPKQDIILVSTSKELFYDVKSGSFKTILSLIQTHTKNGYIPFVEKENFIKEWAQTITGISLIPEAKGQLPSILGNSPELAKEQLQSDINLYNNFMGEQANILDSVCESVLYRFSGTMDGKDVIVLAGGDYQAAEMAYNIPFIGDIAGIAGKAFSEIKEVFSNKKSPSTQNSFSLGEIKNAISESISGNDSGTNKMTFDDWMHGGLIGKMMRDKKMREQQNQIDSPNMDKEETLENEQEPKYAFGHSADQGKHVDLINFGFYRKYACIALKEKEEEATKIFLRFVTSITPDKNLAQRDFNAINQKLSALMQEASRNQAMAQQMHMQTLQMQQQTSQMIARNSQQVSAGIMDSWNKRQAAQSRMSTNYSEAIRGVNSYVTPTGGTVEMSVGADHVYQNKYGDTIGISGNDIDSNLASKLNWTKLEKK